MPTVSIEGIVNLDIPDTWRLLTPDQQVGSNPRPPGLLRLLGLFGVGRGRHSRHMIYGPDGIHMAIHAWHLDESFYIPPPHKRPMLNDDFGYGPIGGTVVERGVLKIQDVDHPWCIREAPDDVTWDEEEGFSTLPFSLDVEAYFPDNQRRLVKVMCGIKSIDSPLIETYQSVLKSLRPSQNS